MTMAAEKPISALMQLLVAAAVLLMMLAHGSMAVNFVVGGPLGWDIPRPNEPDFYQNWVQSMVPYHTGDTLDFEYAHGDSVMLVSMDDYNTCNTIHPMQVWTDGPHSFLMTGYSIYRFISGASGHCAAGQKFTIEAFH